MLARGTPHPAFGHPLPQGERAKAFHSLTILISAKYAASNCHSVG